MTTRTKRARRTRSPSKSNIIYLEKRFPGRFQGPPQERALIQRIVAILETATPDEEARS